ncbi:MAG: twin-arginine translocase TatA/TatE family subunit [Alphaproteobacteria bacterium]
MGTFSVWHWLIVLVVVLVLFGGGGKIPKLMRDMGQGVNAFKKGLKEEDKDKAKAEATSEPKKVAESAAAETTAARVEEKDAAANG